MVFLSFDLNNPEKVKWIWSTVKYKQAKEKVMTFIYIKKRLLGFCCIREQSPWTRGRKWPLFLFLPKNLITLHIQRKATVKLISAGILLDIPVEPVLMMISSFRQTTIIINLSIILVAIVFPLPIPRGSSGASEVRSFGLQHPLWVHRWGLAYLYLSVTHVFKWICRGTFESKCEGSMFDLLI